MLVSLFNLFHCVAVCCPLFWLAEFHECYWYKIYSTANLHFAVNHHLPTCILSFPFHCVHEQLNCATVCWLWIETFLSSLMHSESRVKQWTGYPRRHQCIWLTCVDTHCRQLDKLGPTCKFCFREYPDCVWDFVLFFAFVSAWVRAAIDFCRIYIGIKPNKFDLAFSASHMGQISAGWPVSSNHLPCYLGT